MPLPKIPTAPSSPSRPPIPSLSVSSSPQELLTLDVRDYLPVPDDNTIVHHHPFNLPSLGIVVNLQFRCVICLYCQRAINPFNLIEHVHKDLPLAEVSENLPSTLETTYHLVPYTSVVHSPGAISPVFGLPLETKPIHFCDCGKGYITYETLRTHQTRVGDRSCPFLKTNPGFHKGYGQRLTSNRSFFEVDPTPWRRDLSPPYPLAFCQSLPPLRDYSKMEIKGAEDEMNTSSFFYTQRWLGHLEGHNPEDIKEVTLSSTPEAPFGERLRQVGELFLQDANAQIKNHNSFGILKLMGQTTEYVEFAFLLFLTCLLNLSYLGGKRFIVMMLSRIRQSRNMPLHSIDLCLEFYVNWNQHTPTNIVTPFSIPLSSSVSKPLGRLWILTPLMTN